MDFVWPYIKSASFWHKSGLFNEIEWSIRSVRKFYPGARCIVFGDQPDADVEFIPVLRSETTRIDYRHADIMKKMEAIIDSDVSENFVFMYDDVYFLQKVDIKRQIALKKVEEIDIKGRPGSLLYNNLWKSTFELLQSASDELYDWETHLPRVFNKQRMRWIIDTFDLHNNGLLMTSLYYTYFGETPILLSEHPEIRANVTAMGPYIDLDYEFSKEILNTDDNSYTPKFIERLQNHLK